MTTAHPRQEDLFFWGTHYARTERCESCGAPLALQECTRAPGQLDDTVLRWVEIVADVGGGPAPMAYVIRDHDGDRCRELRRRPR